MIIEASSYKDNLKLNSMLFFLMMAIKIELKVMMELDHELRVAHIPRVRSHQQGCRQAVQQQQGQGQHF